MINISEVVDNYPNIASIFPAEWFESEIRNESDHPLIKELILNDSTSLNYIKELEDCLEMLKNEIKKRMKHFKTLKTKEHFENTLVELKIGCMFKKMGFNIEFEPSVQSGKVSDIKINLENISIFIEVSTRIGPEEEMLIEKENGVKIIGT